MASKIISLEVYREKVLGCWLGKAVGGELFVGIGDNQSWDWLRTAEWRLPLPGS